VGSIEAGHCIPWVEQTPRPGAQPPPEGGAWSSPLKQGAGDHRWPGWQDHPLINAILAHLAAKKLRILLCAPTGPGPPKRMGAKPPGLEPNHHRFAGSSNPQLSGSKAQGRAAAGVDSAVVDETSMVNVPLMASLLDALASRGALLLVG